MFTSEQAFFRQWTYARHPCASAAVGAIRARQNLKEKYMPRFKSASSRRVALQAAASVAIIYAFAACAADGKSPSPLKETVAKATGALVADTDMKQVLDANASLKPKPIEKLSPAEARKQPNIADAVNSLLKQQGRSTEPAALVPGVTNKDIQIDGAAGKLPARIYTPTGAGPFPMVVYFHGGGWVIADKQVYDGGARGIAKEANAVVLSVDYRQAPENKFPAAWDDALAAYRWALANAVLPAGAPVWRAGRPRSTARPRRRGRR